jgi:hypothetical protein
MTSEEKADTPPGAFDTSEAVNVTKTLEEADEAGYLVAVYDDDDLTVQGVTGAEQSAESQAKPPAAVPSPVKEEKAEPERKSHRGE